MNEEGLEVLNEEEHIAYSMWAARLSVQEIAAVLDVPLEEAARTIREAIEKVELRRVINAQDRRLSWS